MYHYGHGWSGADEGRRADSVTVESTIRCYTSERFDPYQWIRSPCNDCHNLPFSAGFKAMQSSGLFNRIGRIRSFREATSDTGSAQLLIWERKWESPFQLAED